MSEFKLNMEMKEKFGSYVNTTSQKRALCLFDIELFFNKNYALQAPSTDKISPVT